MEHEHARAFRGAAPRSRVAGLGSRWHDRVAPACAVESRLRECAISDHLKQFSLCLSPPVRQIIMYRYV